MKKNIVTLLCTAALLLGAASPPALAAGGPYYPVSVEEYTYGSFDELRINKVYQLALTKKMQAKSRTFVRDFSMEMW